MSRRLWDSTPPSAEPVLWDTLNRYAGVLVSEHKQRPRDLRDTLMSLLPARLAGAEGLLYSAAAELGMSPRSLQRSLRERGTTFTCLVAEARERTAKRLLADPNLTLSEIAARLGFAEQNSFARAFRGWTGVAPSGYRARGILPPHEAS